MSPLFEQDPARSQRYSLEAAGLFCDYSKNLIDDEALATLLSIAEATELPRAIDALFTGQPINSTEGRPALHSLLRHHRAEAQPEKYAQVIETQRRVLLD